MLMSVIAEMLNYPLVWGWILIAIVAYVWHYFIEVILDLPIIGQSPCSAHASLKLLLGRIVQEAIGLPKLTKVKDVPTSKDDRQIDRTYEDLLSTAILNKVIQNYQEELSRSASRDVSEICSSIERLETASPDADDYDESDDQSHMPLYKYIKPASVFVSEQPPYENNNSDENWSLQKRSRETTPVPMLVPKPNVEVNVLIGDKKAEDLSDLSDTISELEVESSDRNTDNNNSKIEVEETNAQHKEDNLDETVPAEENEIYFEGSYSAREKQKWQHAIEMKNNPYTEENLKQRLRDYVRHDRDYYIQQAKCASGGDSSEKKDIFHAVPIAINDFSHLTGNVNDNIKLLLKEENNNAVVEQENAENESEILNLKERRLVSNRLGQFSKSTSHLDTSCHEPISIVKGVSVEKLKSLFNQPSAAGQNEQKFDQVYSLTARSIPHEFRQELKTKEKFSDRRTSNDINWQENELNLQSQEFSDTKTKIKYFEKLNC